MSKAVDEVKVWLTPILILVIGWLLSNKLNTIDKNFEKLEPLLTQVAEMRYRLNFHEQEIDNLKKSLQAHDVVIMPTTSVLGKPEDELSYERLKKTGMK